MTRHYRNYTNEQLIEAVRISYSTAEVLRKLNLKGGGSVDNIRRKISRMNLDTSHFTGQAWNKGKKFGYKYPLEDYLNNKRYIHSHNLRLRLFDENVFERKCSSCGLIEWMGNPMPLELDHIDGDHQNNNLLNLRILCPNCHVFTPTYKAKNRKN